MTGRVKINKKIPDFSQSKTLFQFNKICSVMRVKFAPSLNIWMEFEDDNLSHCVRKV